MNVVVQHAQTAIAPSLVTEQLQLFGELCRQVIAHEAEVVVLRADLERALHAVRRDDRLPDRETQVIWIDRQRRLLLRGVGADDVRVRLQRVQVFVLRQKISLAQ